MASGLAPIKPEFRRKAGARIVVEAVLGSTTPAAAAVSAAADAAQPGSRDQQPQQAQKKSRNQQRKDRKEARQSAAELCHAFAHGRCRFGDGCRFSHDVAAYLAAKAPELPGRCPFSAADTCPYGITCRWASQHANPDALTREYVIVAPRTTATADGAGANAAAADSAAQPAAVAVECEQADGKQPQQAEDATWATGSGAHLQRSTETAAAAAALADGAAAAADAGTGPLLDAAAVPQEPPEQQQRDVVGAGESTTPTHDGAAAASSDAAWLDGVGSGGGGGGVAAVADAAGAAGSSKQAAGSRIEELPVAAALPPCTNFLEKGVQIQLRKNTFDFSHADGVLQRLGLKAGRQIKKSAAKAQRQLQQQGGGQQQSAQQQSDQQQTGRHQNGQPSGSKQSALLGGSSRRHAPAAPTALDAEMSGDEGPDPAQPANLTHAAPGAAASQNLQQDRQQAGQPAVAAALDAEWSGDEREPQPAVKRQKLDATAAGNHVAPPIVAAPAANEAAPMDEDAAASPAPDSAAAPLVVTDPAAVNTPSAATPAAVMPSTAGSGPTSSSQPQPQPLFDTKTAAAAGANAPDAPLRAAEKKRLDLRGKTYLAPLTTVGNLPFRRVCKQLGVDITCGEMAMATNIIQGTASEWALLRRHPCEDIFGAQICGGFPDAMARCCQLLDENVDVDFVDINMGCPIDLVCNKGAGSALLQKPGKMAEVVRSAAQTLSCPLTVKLRKGYYDGKDVAHNLIPQVASWGAAAVTLHGRTRQQRYSRLADWDYIQRCASTVPEDFQMLGNGDVYNFEQWNELLGNGSSLASLMVGRAALIKPWIFTEIKDQRHWDISATERLDLLKDFCAYGLTHWGSDSKGVESTRRFLLEWLSFTHRYIPVGLLETASQAAHLNWRNPGIVGRSDLESLLASDDPRDWMAISERLLGPPPPGFIFQPKHKAQTHARSEMDMALGADDGAENG